MTTLEMEIIKRDDVAFQLTFTDSDGNAIDLTGATIFFTVKKNKTDDDVDAVISKQIDSFDNPITGVAQLDLTNSDTNILVGSYWFDIQLKDSNSKISSSAAGRFIVAQDVTIRTS